MCQRAVLTILPMRGKKLLVVRMGRTRFFNTLGGLHGAACLDSGSVGLCKVQRGGSAHGQTGLAVYSLVLNALKAWGSCKYCRCQ